MLYHLAIEKSLPRSVFAPLAVWLALRPAALIIGFPASGAWRPSPAGALCWAATSSIRTMATAQNWAKSEACSSTPRPSLVKWHSRPTLVCSSRHSRYGHRRGTIRAIPPKMCHCCWQLRHTTLAIHAVSPCSPLICCFLRSRLSLLAGPHKAQKGG